ncbi:uncharacterized protein [Typha latifolia]|uniref:uncharacterized protein n=1 Tax=Typha latifolia TaxID=4733 RepID=UPI003C30CFD3
MDIDMVALRGDSSSEHDKTGLLSGEDKDDDVLHNMKNDLELEKESSYSCSYSSDLSSEENYIQLDASELMRSVTGKYEIPSSNVESLQVGENSKLEPAVIDLLTKPEVGGLNQDESGFPGSYQEGQGESGTPISPYVPPTCSSGSDNFASLGVKQSPPIQLVGVSDYTCPDPNRIPASVFARSKSTKPMEWSVQSNESLFSIHIGRSGDLTGFYSSQFDFTPISPIPGHAATKDLGLGSDLKQPVVIEAENTEATKDDLRTDVDDYAAEGPTNFDVSQCDNISEPSDSSLVSYRSFAFPILTREGRNMSMKGDFEHQQAQYEPPQQPPRQPEPPNEVPVAEKEKLFSCFCCCCVSDCL